MGERRTPYEPPPDALVRLCARALLHALARKATKIDRVCDTLRELTERAQKAHSAQLERSVRAEASASKPRPKSPQHLDAV